MLTVGERITLKEICSSLVSSCKEMLKKNQASKGFCDVGTNALTLRYKTTVSW